MISVLIPIYNHDVRKLVLTLSEQCRRCGINFQLLCFDDGSNEKFKKINRSIESLYGVSYIEFGENIGRARIRNKLGFNAMFDNIIFLDCDSKIVRKTYIKKYLDVIGKSPVVYGGTIYSKRAPRSKKKKLHWLYGQLRERLPLPKRVKLPYQSFRSNNFMMDRTTFLNHPFDETIKGYGHEDTLFAQDLKKAGIGLLHIDNPVQHGGLEPTDRFLQKVEESLSNLLKLQEEGKSIETSLTLFYNKLANWSVLPAFRIFWRLSERLIERSLFSTKPSIYALDLYKLKVYDDLIRNKRGSR